MFAFPQRGIARSVEAHNVDLDVLSDWIEGSVLFIYENGEAVAKANIVDSLCDAQIYERQAFAWEIVSDSWGELRRRRASMGDTYPLQLGADTVERLVDWRQVPAHSFCLTLSFAKWYPEWARGFGSDFREQGELFELMTREALEALFQGWKFHLTGWSRTHRKKLGKVVAEVAGLLSESVGKVEQWTKPTANEAGLDLLCYRPFLDGRVGVPVYLLQCASGGNWQDKLHTPNLDIWMKIVQFAAKPRKAFATPFPFLDHDFVMNCNLVNGLLLDRYRLLSAGAANPNWLSVGLAQRMIAWMEPRIAALPRATQVL